MASDFDKKSKQIDRELCESDPVMDFYACHQ
jgi:hypothetical protein